MKNFRFLIFWLLLALGTATGCAQNNANTVDEGVVINGVKWATRNVDKPGTFADKPEDFGMLYQWNRRVGWSVTEPIINSNGGTAWDTTEVTGTIIWEKSNDPSPVGWRVPTLEEIKSLLDTEKVTNEWTTQNDVNGRKFTDRTSGKSIFLPAAGWRYDSSGTLGRGVGEDGAYWSSTRDVSKSAYSFTLVGFARWAETASNNFGFSVRCVAE